MLVTPIMRTFLANIRHTLADHSIRKAVQHRFRTEMLHSRKRPKTCRFPAFIRGCRNDYAARAFCSQTESSDVAQMRLKNRWSDGCPDLSGHPSLQVAE